MRWFFTFVSPPKVKKTWEDEWVIAWETLKEKRAKYEAEHKKEKKRKILK